jgi:hypothetical protein
MTQVWKTIVLCFRKNLAITVTTLLLMWVALPVILLMVPIKFYDSTTIAELFRNLTAIPFFAISAVALILCAGQMFTYLHSRTATDVYHVLPVRRQTLFAGRFLGGFLLVLVPQILTFSSILVIRLLPGYQILDMSLVIQTTLAFMLISLALYAVAVLAFVLTGTLFDAMFLLLMLNVVWPGTLLTIDTFVSMILPGFSMGNFASLVDVDRYLLLAPAGELLKVCYQPMRLFEVFWWIALTLVMILGSMLVYRRRPSEFAGRPLVYRLPFLIVRFMVTLVAGLIFGYLYYETYANLAAFIFSAAVGSLATHTLIEVILSRGFRNFRRSLISYGVFIILFAAGCVVVATGFFGFDTRLPAIDKIIEVRLTSRSDLVIFNRYGSYDGFTYSDPENIAALLEMNENWLDKMQTLVRKPYSLKTNDWLDNYDNGKDSGPSSEPSRIVYKMASGFERVRTVYFNFNEEPYASLYNQIRKTEEYKRQYYRYFFEPDSVLSEICLDDKDGQSVLSMTQAKDEQVLAKILTALREDLLQDADGQSGGRFLGYLEITVFFDFTGPVDNQGYTSHKRTFQLTDAFCHTMAVLEEHHLLDNLGAHVDSYIAAYMTSSNGEAGSLLYRLIKNPSRGYGPYFYPGQQFADVNLPLLNDSQFFLKIEDPDVIRSLYLRGQDVETTQDGGYLVILATAGQVKTDGTATSDLLALYLPGDHVAEALAKRMTQ